MSGKDDSLIIYTDTKGEEGFKEIMEYLYEITGISPRAVTIRSVSTILKNESGKTLYSELEI